MTPPKTDEAAKIARLAQCVRDVAALEADSDLGGAMKMAGTEKRRILEIAADTLENHVLVTAETDEAAVEVDEPCSCLISELSGDILGGPCPACLAQPCHADKKTERLKDALEEQKAWHESEAKALSKQPPAGDRDWRRLQHREQIDAIDAALAAMHPEPAQTGETTQGADRGEWRTIDSAPKDGTEIRLLLADGRTAIGEWWDAPPIEIDPDQTFCGWAICLIEGGKEGLGIDCGDIPDPTHWAPAPPSQVIP